MQYVTTRWEGLVLELCNVTTRRRDQGWKGGGWSSEGWSSEG